MQQFLSERIVPVAVIDSVADAPAIAQALCDGGLHTIELTLRTPAADVIWSCRFRGHDFDAQAV